MATAIKVCRVCGKEYEACHTLKRVAGVFRWQEVACSPECGGVYLAKIEESRTGTSSVQSNVNKDKLIEDVTGDDYGVIDYNDAIPDDDFDDEIDVDEDFDD